MVEQNRSGAYSEIVYAPTADKIEIMNGQSQTKAFVPLPGGAVAEYGAGTVYRHSDHLGSSRFASTLARTMYFDGAYAPFGEPYAQTGTTDLSFTGMNQDTVSNLYDFPAREYGIQGRWASPDPAGLAAADLTDPQSWNRFSYVRNTPTNLIDPVGMDGIKPPGAGAVQTSPPCQTYSCGFAYYGGYDAGWQNLSSFFSNTWSGFSFLSLAMTPTSGGGDSGPYVYGNWNLFSQVGNISGNSSGSPFDLVPANPCAYAGRALDPGAYAASGSAAKWNPITAILDLKDFRRGKALDAQPLATGNPLQRAAYGNYAFGTYMQAAGVPLSAALVGANAYAFTSGAKYGPSNGPMDPSYGSLPAVNVDNITNGYNAQMNGTTCHK